MQRDRKGYRKRLTIFLSLKEIERCQGKQETQSQRPRKTDMRLGETPGE